MKRIISLNSDQKNKLFNILLDLKFVKRKMNNNTVFELGTNIIVYPELIRTHHLIYTRKHLDTNGLLSAEDFHSKMNLKQIEDKYFIN